MIVNLLLSVSISINFVVFSFSQNPYKVAPEAYRLQFENKWLRVTRVHYAPHTKIPSHDHSRWPAAYVYLNDSGPIIFRHVGWDEPVLTRPPTKTGSFRLSPTSVVNETHEVENQTETPSDFLRIEFKTNPVGRKSLYGRFRREDYPVDVNLQKVEFENQQIRVTRLICAPHKSLDILTTSSEPALLIALSSSGIKFIGDKGEAKPMTVEIGQTLWLEKGKRERIENPADAPVEFLRFDLRTAPVLKKTGKQ